MLESIEALCWQMVKKGKRRQVAEEMPSDDDIDNCKSILATVHLSSYHLHAVHTARNASTAARAEVGHAARESALFAISVE